MTMPAAIEVERLLREAILSKAAGLGRAGRYRDAAALLDGLPAGEDGSARVLDLRARFLAQQGRLSEAEQLWLRAVALDPAEPAYRDALKRIARIGQRAAGITGSGARRLAAALVVVAAVVAGLFALDRRLARFRAALDSDLERIVGQRPAQGSAPARARPPDIHISVPGVAAAREREDLVLRFDSGLFRSGASLTTSARQALSGLALQLEPYAASISVTVCGHSDSEPLPAGAAFADNSALALARAVVVAGFLRRSAHLSSDAVLVEGLGEQAAPYPNDNRANRLRNRTVILRIRSRPFR